MSIFLDIMVLTTNVNFHLVAEETIFFWVTFVYESIPICVDIG
jgi:hypothetical protein